MKKSEGGGKGKKKKAGRERDGFKTSRHGTGKRASAGGPKGQQKRAAEAREAGRDGHATGQRSRFLAGQAISPPAITGRETAAELIDSAFLAYNAARLREACLLYTR
jgi:hypothetical protein